MLVYISMSEKLKDKQNTFWSISMSEKQNTCSVYI